MTHCPAGHGQLDVISWDESGVLRKCFACKRVWDGDEQIEGRKLAPDDPTNAWHQETLPTPYPRRCP
jgi:hypothetical protein